MRSFNTYWRNPGHWDVSRQFEGQPSRVFRIRGGEHERQWGGDGDVIVYDERPQTENRGIVLKFKSVGAAMAYITAELMTEPKEEVKT